MNPLSLHEAARWLRDYSPKELAPYFAKLAATAHRIGCTFEGEFDPDRDLHAIRLVTFPEASAENPVWEGIMWAWSFVIEGATPASVTRFEIEIRVRESALALASHCWPKEPG